MKRYFLVFIILLSLSVVSCQRQAIRKTLRNMMSSDIIFPDNLVCIKEGRDIIIPDSFADESKLIIYIDSTDCTNCRITHFFDYIRYFSLSDKTGLFDTVLLLSTTKASYQETLKYIKLLEFPFPVYMDPDNMFLAINKTIPNDIRFHTICVNRSGRVLFVGLPENNSDIIAVFSGNKVM